MAYGLEGKLVRLVPLDPAKHTDLLLRWINDPTLTRTLGGGTYPTTRQMQEEYIESVAKNEWSNGVKWMIETLDGRTIGTSDLRGLNPIHRTAASGSFIGPLEERGKGYGKEAVALRSRYAFRTLNLETLYASHLEGNEASHRMLESNGYEFWGERPKAFFKDGRYWSEFCCALTRERWESLFGSEQPLA